MDKDAWNTQAKSSMKEVSRTIRNMARVKTTTFTTHTMVISLLEIEAVRVLASLQQVSIQETGSWTRSVAKAFSQSMVSTNTQESSITTSGMGRELATTLLQISTKAAGSSE